MEAEQRNRTRGGSGGRREDKKIAENINASERILIKNNVLR